MEKLIPRVSGSGTNLATALANLGRAERLLRKFSAATEHLERAAQIYADSNCHDERARTLTALASCHLDQGHAALALHYGP